MARVHNEINPRRNEVGICNKFTLFGLNVIFWTCSVITLGVCSYILYDSRELYDNIGSFVFTPLIVIILVAVVVFLTTFVGCLGALRENIKLLTIYQGVLLFLVAMELCSSAMCFIFSGQIKSHLTQKLGPTIPNYRDSPQYQETIDEIQKKLHCCGLKSVDDWGENKYFDCSSPGFEACGVPHSCCNEKTRLVNGVLNTQCGLGVRKTKSSTIRSQRIYTVGCVDAGVAFLKDNLIVIASVCVAVFLLQILSISLATSLKSKIKYLPRFD